MKFDLNAGQLKKTLALLNQVSAAAVKAREALDALRVLPALAGSNELAGQLKEINQIRKAIKKHSAMMGQRDVAFNKALRSGLQ